MCRWERAKRVAANFGKTKKGEYLFEKDAIQIGYLPAFRSPIGVCTKNPKE
jgi:hypothetical protein